MNSNKEFGTGILYTITNCIYFFMMTNIYFILSNLLLIIFVVMLEPTLLNGPFYLLALILTGPSIAALYGCSVKYIETKEGNPTSDYFSFYRKNFLDTLKVWSPLCVVGFILFVNVQFFHHHNPIFDLVLKMIFLFLFIMLVLGSIYTLLINVKFKFRVIDIFRLSNFYLFTQLKITLGNLGILFIILVAMYRYSDFLMFFVASPLCYWIIKNSYSILHNVQEQFIQK